MILCSIQRKRSSPFLSLSMFLECSQFFVYFSASRSYKKKVLIREKECVKVKNVRERREGKLCVQSLTVAGEGL